jgi:hypothetical protein
MQQTRYMTTNTGIAAVALGQLQVFTSDRFRAVNPFTAVKLATYNS